MRYISMLLSIFVTLGAYGQACKMPSSLDIIKPERCGIRYVTSEGDQVKVILEFEKKTRIITPNNPSDVKGQPVNLIGLYYLTYNRQGDILEEKKVFVQTGEIPDRGLVFGLNGQRGELLEDDLKLISTEEYKQVPYGGLTKQPNANAQPAVKVDHYFETQLNVEKNLKLLDLQVVKWHRKNGVDSLVPTRKKASLELYDSCTKKNYWTNLYLPTTDPAEGYTLALLNHFDRETAKEVSQKRFRLVSLDTSAQTAGQHDLEFETAMEVAYRNEIFSKNDLGADNLDKQIWVLKSKDSGEGSQKLGQYYFYVFNKLAQIQTSALVVSKHEIFDPNNVYWQDHGVFYMSNTGHEIVSCFIGNDGKHTVFTTGERLTGLKSLIEGRKKNGHHTVGLSIYQDPQKYDDGTVLMIYKVDENVGVGASMGVNLDDAIATKVNHGFVVVLLSPDGQIKSTDYYQRPVNADPRAALELGPIERTAKGTISFYATERTSDGVYLILCTIKNGQVTFVKNEKGNIATRHIYYDADQQIVSYFGSVKDPDDPRVNVRTLEVLMTR